MELAVKEKKTTQPAPGPYIWLSLKKKISVFSMYFMNQNVPLEIPGEDDCLHMFINTNHYEKSMKQSSTGACEETTGNSPFW